MDFLNRKAIKQEARDFIAVDRKWLTMFGAIVIYILLDKAEAIFTVLKNRSLIFNANTIKYFFDYYNKSGDAQLSSTLSSLASLIRILLIPFAVAMAGYFLNHLRGFKPSAKSLYAEGIDNYGVYFKGMLLTYISIILWTCLFIVPGIVKAIEYSQVPYLLHDNKRLTPSQAKKISSIMTNGYKADLFVLELSFIGWHLISALTCGLAYIYVLPYINTVNAMYYENLKNNAIEKRLVAPEAFMETPPVFQNFNTAFENQQENYAQPQNCEQPQIYSQPQNYTQPEQAQENVYEKTDSANSGSFQNGEHTQNTSENSEE